MVQQYMYIGIIAALVLFIIIDKLFKKDKGNLEKTMKDELERLRHDNANNSMLGRQELSKQLQSNQESFIKQYTSLVNASETKLENIRTTLKDSIFAMSQENSRQLERMRNVVDEKLQSTLEKRLNESFSLVSSRLEQVYKGLGEMQSLARGVGDLNKILQNVKTRGLWGEAQLRQLLEEILSPTQYEENSKVNPNYNGTVEFAIVLPGKQEKVYLPIDCKFPQEDYLRLIDASDNADKVAAALAQKELYKRIKQEAQSISEKYIAPPYTTDFAIMYLPVEGLYSEVVKSPGLFEDLQKLRIVVCGPTTFVAILNSLSVGFRTLSIEQHSSQVWQLLGAIKDEFAKFSALLEKTQKKLQEANNVIESASRKSRTITRKLRDVEQLPAGEMFEELEDEQ